MERSGARESSLSLEPSALAVIGAGLPAPSRQLLATFMMMSIAGSTGSDRPLFVRL